MEKVVKIYQVTCTDAYRMDETGTRYSLMPWGENAGYYKGYDDGGVDYYLPDGYEVALDNDDMPHIYPIDSDQPVRLGGVSAPTIDRGDDFFIALKRV